MIFYARLIIFWSYFALPALGYREEAVAPRSELDAGCHLSRRRWSTGLGCGGGAAFRKTKWETDLKRSRKWSWIHWNSLKFIEIHWNSLEFIGIHWFPLKFHWKISFLVGVRARNGVRCILCSGGGVLGGSRPGRHRGQRAASEGGRNLLRFNENQLKISCKSVDFMFVFLSFQWVSWRFWMCFLRPSASPCWCGPGPWRGGWAKWIASGRPCSATQWSPRQGTCGPCSRPAPMAASPTPRPSATRREERCLRWRWFNDKKWLNLSVKIVKLRSLVFYYGLFEVVKEWVAKGGDTDKHVLSALRAALEGPKGCEQTWKGS